MERLITACLIFVILGSVSAQESDIPKGQLHGDFLIDAQYYINDSVIGTPEYPERVGMNAYGNFNYTYGNFKAGIRYESYQNTLLGFDPRYEGSGITYRYLQYENEELQITVGNFYEQFGNGLTLRSYWEWYLGLDNSIDGIRVHYAPIPGIKLKALIGKQRFYFDQGPGIVRGMDADININEITGDALRYWKTNITVGGSAVSRFQEDRNSQFILPENVATFAGRVNLNRGIFSLNSEYSYKVNDPTVLNNTSYKYGESFIVNASMAVSGFGANLGFKRWDNMDFRSDRSATGFDLFINYQPSLARQHTYRFSSMYTYPTAPTGEMALQGDFFFNFKRKSFLGGKYGTKLAINMSAVNDIKRDPIEGLDEGRQLYTSNFFSFGEQKFYRDINIELTKKLTKSAKILLSYMYQEINNVNQPISLSGNVSGIIYSHIGIADISYKLNSTNTIRTEIQHNYTEQDFGSWAMLLVEYTVSPHWFFTVMDEYNYGNPSDDLKVHYPSGAIGYRKGTNSIKLGGGRQRAGFLCVGGICRPVPANNGVTLTLASSF